MLSDNKCRLKMTLNHLFVQIILHLTREYKTVKLTKWILILRKSGFFFLIKIKTRVDKGVSMDVFTSGCFQPADATELARLFDSISENLQNVVNHREVHFLKALASPNMPSSALNRII